MVNTQNPSRVFPFTLPAVMLRLEGLVVFIGAIAAYATVGGPLWLFLLLLLAPDFAMLGYLNNPRLGSLFYNLAHTYTAPALLLALSLGLGITPLIALIWTAHIGMDRTVGYGLKYSTAFKDTHLNRV